jgi:cytochrome c oxidase assembly factor CtaG/polyferredoxin
VDPVEVFLRSWPIDLWVILPLLATGWVYSRGWYGFRQRGSHRWQTRHLASFLGGLGLLYLALASPIEPFSSLLLSVHMVQHLLLMMAAPPLLWAGAPLLPLFRGLPGPIRRYWGAPLFRWKRLRRALVWLTRPGPAWLLYIAATWFWHIPAIYELALASAMWHYVQHGCFLATAMLFWWPVIEPYPGRVRWSRWLLVPYLILADLQNTLLSAVLCFSERVWYPHYEAMPRLWQISAQEDQAIAGVIMWVPGSLAYLVPLVGIVVRLMNESNPRVARSGVRAPTGEPRPPAIPSGAERTSSVRASRPGEKSNRYSLPLVESPRARPGEAPFDLLAIPLLGRFLRWRYARPALQVPLLLLAIVLIGDGLAGPQEAPMNLAGVLPWIHWRGLVIVGLLAVGNVFCLACPFMLPRTLARRWLPADRSWPWFLRSKWPAIALLVLFLWGYEAFALWDSPWLTAWIAIGYFVAAFLIDGLFRGASFCKYVCPIGQFHFVQSLVSPVEVKVIDPEKCRTCTTRDCIRGNDQDRGCELHLFGPRKSSNMDCTFCLDCVHACPQDNIGLLTTVPGAELTRDPSRSGIGKFSRRPDLAVLVLILVFGAFVNAAGMVAPVVAWQDRLTASLGLSSPVPVTSAIYLVGLIAVPVLLVGLAGSVSRRWSGDPGRWLESTCRYCFALVPLGFAMWFAHYLLHFLTSAGTVIPVTQRLVNDLGGNLGEPAWSWCCCLPVAGWLLRLEIVALQLGMLLSLYLAWRIAESRHSGGWTALRAFLPWAVLVLVLFVFGIWIVFQPMQMRGTLGIAG